MTGSAPASRAALAALTAYMAKTLAFIFGIILILLGLLGFVNNPLIGAGALFATDAMFSVIFIILGALLIIVALRSGGNSALWLKIVGAILFLLGFIGAFTVPSAGGTVLGIAYANGATNWLNLVAGIAVFVAGMYGREGAGAALPPQSAPPPQQPMR